MQLVDHLYTWVDMVLFIGLIALRIWAIVDCAMRKAKAFPAVNKLTKPAWLAMLIVSGLLGSLFLYAPLHPLSLISLIITLVYLTDVRPAVKEITGGG